MNAVWILLIVVGCMMAGAYSMHKRKKRGRSGR